MTSDSNQLRYDGRVAVITGAGRGLGREYALLLASRGAHVVVNDLGGSIQGSGEDSNPAEDVVKEIIVAGGSAIASTDSVATEAGGKAIIDTALSHFGKVDILIHNAGNVRRGGLHEVSFEDFKAVLDVHLLGAFNVLRPALVAMRDAEFGRVVLTSSVGGMYGHHEIAAYAPAKAAMIGLCNVAAIEGAAHDITCNVISPGAITRLAEGLDTSFYPPMGPELVAPLVAWLVHEQCKVSGEYLSAMAGRLSRMYIAETPGVYLPEWSVEEVAKREVDIRDNSREPWIFSPVIDGQTGHILRSFQAARDGHTQ